MLGWVFFVDDVCSISSSIFLVHFGRLWIYFVSMWHLVLSDPSATHGKPSGPARNKKYQLEINFMNFSELILF